MLPFYWESAHGNFGDDLNLWLWDFLLPGFRDVHDETLLVGVGTVLNQALMPGAVHKLVVGSGFGYGALPDFSVREEWDLRCVRGPLTAAKVGLDPRLGIVDPAVMVADMPEFQGIPNSGETIFVPHWESTVGGAWPAVCKAVGIGYVDPCSEARSVIRSIAGAGLVIAESMHAAILADAFRVPWVAVSTSQNVNSVKWQDWAASLDVTYRPRRIALSSRAEAITKRARFWGVDYDDRAAGAPIEPEHGDVVVLARRDPPASALRSAAKQFLAAPAMLGLWQARWATPQLSDDRVLAERKQRLQTVLEGVRRDYF